MTQPKAHLEISEDNLTLMQEYAENNDQPIVMVNLMQVRDTAQYEDGSAPISCVQRAALYAQDSCVTARDVPRCTQKTAKTSPETENKTEKKT